MFIQHFLSKLFFPTFFFKFFFNFFKIFQKECINNVIERNHSTLAELMSTNSEIIKFIVKPVVNLRTILSVNDHSIFLTHAKRFLSRHM